VCWLLWFSCQYLPSDWLERRLWGHLNMVRRLPPQSPDGRECLCVFFFCLSMFLCVPPGPTQYIFHTSMFVLKVSLNTKWNQTNLENTCHTWALFWGHNYDSLRGAISSLRSFTCTKLEFYHCCILTRLFTGDVDLVENFDEEACREASQWRHQSEDHPPSVCLSCLLCVC